MIIIVHTNRDLINVHIDIQLRKPQLILYIQL